jgi:endonuclease/exonuclease/phosphatase family metal-dependent hydrolase
MSMELVVTPCPAEACERVRVATYNVHRSIGTDGVHDVSRTAEVIRQTGASILALQEVEDHTRDPDALARATGMRALPGHTMASPDSNYGNLLLTKLEIESSQAVDLSWGEREPRGVIDARLRTSHGRSLRCLVTHLGLTGRERRYQHRLLMTLLSGQHNGPTLLMGDFNEWRPYAATLRALNRLLGPAHARRSFPSRFPLLPLDRIWVSPDSLLLSLYTLKTPLTRVASDHLPVIAELALRELEEFAD